MRENLILAHVEIFELSGYLAQVSEWAAIPLMVLGIALCLAGKYFIRLIVMIAAFIPVSVTVHLLALSFGGLSNDDAMMAAGGAGLVAALIASAMYKRIHVILAGAFGLVVGSIILGFISEIYEIDSIVLLLLHDVSFMIGARAFRGWEEELHFAAPSAIGGLFIGVGWSLWSAVSNNLSEVDPFSTENSIILFVAMMSGAFFQLWMFGEGGYLDQKKALEAGHPTRRPARQQPRNDIDFL